MYGIALEFDSALDYGIVFDSNCYHTLGIYADGVMLYSFRHSVCPFICLWWPFQGNIFNGLIFLRIIFFTKNIF